MRKRKRAKRVTTSRSGNFKKIRAAGGVLFRMKGERVQLLMIVRNGVWDLPKGKLEDGESIPECAAREVAEETGLNKMPLIEAELGTTYHTYSESGIEIEKETFWFVMRLQQEPDEFTPQKSEGITKTEWVDVGRAEDLAGFENLKEMISKFRKYQSNLKYIEN